MRAGDGVSAVDFREALGDHGDGDGYCLLMHRRCFVASLGTGTCMWSAGSTCDAHANRGSCARARKVGWRGDLVIVSEDALKNRNLVNL